jgi:hypothetical protein
MILLSVHYRLLQICRVEVVKTAANPNGDGSGKVKHNCRYAISYKFVFLMERLQTLQVVF